MCRTEYLIIHDYLTDINKTKFQTLVSKCYKKSIIISSQGTHVYTDVKVKQLMTTHSLRVENE